MTASATDANMHLASMLHHDAWHCWPTFVCGVNQNNFLRKISTCFGLGKGLIDWCSAVCTQCSHALCLQIFVSICAAIDISVITDLLTWNVSLCLGCNWPYKWQTNLGCGWLTVYPPLLTTHCHQKTPKGHVHIYILWHTWENTALGLSSLLW